MLFGIVCVWLFLRMIMRLLTHDSLGHLSPSILLREIVCCVRLEVSTLETDS